MAETLLGGAALLACLAVEAFAWWTEAWWHDHDGPPRDPRNGI